MRRYRRTSLHHASVSAIISRSSARNRRFCSFAALEHRPCLRLAAAHFDFPASVRGPVDAPPCNLQRRRLPVRGLTIAGHWQRVPRLVFAPQRRARAGLPPGAPFLRRPLLGLTGVTACCATAPVSMESDCDFIKLQPPRASIAARLADNVNAIRSGAIPRIAGVAKLLFLE
jgi:hypothetical protein